MESRIGHLCQYLLYVCIHSPYGCRLCIPHAINCSKGNSLGIYRGYAPQRSPINGHTCCLRATVVSSSIRALWCRRALSLTQWKAFCARSAPQALEHRRDSDLVPFPQTRQGCGSDAGFIFNCARWVLHMTLTHCFPQRSVRPTTSHSQWLNSLIMEGSIL